MKKPNWVDDFGQVNWKEPHAFEFDEVDFGGRRLCKCGLPGEVGLHLYKPAPHQPEECKNCEPLPGKKVYVESAYHPKCTECGRDLSALPIPHQPEGWEKQVLSMVRDICTVDYDNDMAAANIEPPDSVLLTFIRSLLAQRERDVVRKTLEKLLVLKQEYIDTDFGTMDYEEYGVQVADWVDKQLKALIQKGTT